MKKELILVIDFGTSKVSASLINLIDASIESVFTEKYKWLHSKPGFTEINPIEIWEASQKTISKLIKNCDNYILKNIVGITFSFFGDNIIPVDKNGFKLYDLLPAFDSRSMNEVDYFKKHIKELDFIKITGGNISTMCVGTKILWLKNNLINIFKKSKYFFDIQQFILKKLGFEAYNDYTMASRKMLFNIREKKWSENLLNIIDVSKESMGYDVIESKQLIGEISKYGNVELKNKIPVILGAHDTDCGIIGLGAISEECCVLGDLIGTFDLMGYMSKEVQAPEKILSGMVFNNCSPEKDYYIAIGGVSTGGALLEWYTSEFYDNRLSKSKLYKLLDSKSEFNGCNNVIVLPNYDLSSGCIFGLNLSNSKLSIYQALMEGVTYESKGIFEILNKKFDNCNAVRIGGGGSKSEKWLQLKADVFCTKVEKPRITEVSTLGAAIIASVGLNYYRNIKEAVKNMVKIEKVFYPDRDISFKYMENYDKYHKLKKAINYFNKNN